MEFLTKAVTPKNREKPPRFIVSSTNFQATHDSHRARVTVLGSPFSISALSLAGRSTREKEREREVAGEGSALTPRRIISVSTDPNFWPARIFRPLRPTNFDQLTRKGYGLSSFSAGARIHRALSCFPYTATRWLSTRVYRLCCCVQRPERMLWMRPA